VEEKKKRGNSEDNGEREIADSGMRPFSVKTRVKKLL